MSGHQHSSRSEQSNNPESEEKDEKNILELPAKKVPCSIFANFGFPSKLLAHFVKREIPRFGPRFLCATFIKSLQVQFTQDSREFFVCRVNNNILTLSRKLHIEKEFIFGEQTNPLCTLAGVNLTGRLIAFFACSRT
jgi:hypothetical protein